MKKSLESMDSDGVSDPPVLLDVADGLAVITLNRPDRNNAIDAAWVLHMTGSIEKVATTPGIRVLLIRANGPRFCVGADLDWIRPAEASARDRVSRILLDMNPALIALRTLPLIVVTAVHGAVAGGGFGLMSAADLVIASSETRFSLAYTRIGGTPDLGASYFLPRALGERRALELMLLSEPFDAAKALALGLVNFVAPQESFDAEVKKRVNQLLVGPAEAFAAVKKLTYRSLGATMHDQLDCERQTFVSMTEGSDLQEGVKAFVEKRAACFGKASGGANG